MRERKSKTKKEENDSALLLFVVFFRNERVHSQLVDRVDAKLVRELLRRG